MKLFDGVKMNASTTEIFRAVTRSRRKLRNDELHNLRRSPDIIFVNWVGSEIYAQYFSPENQMRERDLDVIKYKNFRGCLGIV